MLQGKNTGNTKNRLLHLFQGLLLATSCAFVAPFAGAEDLRTGAVIPDASVARPSVAVQAAVPVDGSWIEFSHSGPGTFAMGCQQGGDPNGFQCIESFAGNSTFGSAPPWTFTAPSAGAALTLTDAFIRGEAFEVFDFGVSIGTTPTVSAVGGCGDNPDNCLADPLVSHAVFPLAAGAHEITIKVTASGYGSGAAYFRVAAAAPADEGCGPGYWKTHPASWPPTGYSPSQKVATVFSAAVAFPTLANKTLVESLKGGGGPGTVGSATILLRAAVTALLNASDPDIAYPRTPASVISAVNAALASNDRVTMLMLAIALDQDNNGEGGCPFDGCTPD